MKKLEREGCTWRSGDKPTELTNCWSRYGREIVVYVNEKYLTIGHIGGTQGALLIEKYTKETNRLVVPQFVADWYEKHKCELEYRIWEYIYDWDDQDRESDFYDFMNYGHNRAIETLINMQNGYEVEKEQLYYVKLVNTSTGYLNVYYDNQKTVSSKESACGYKTQFTEAEIKSMDKGEAYWLLKEPVNEVSK
ncbi:DUF1642 domain-containing protein [Listeria monocytogenes]|nr:DUF1642 domain-containing protein [Listeria monocytogenes]